MSDEAFVRALQRRAMPLRVELAPWDELVADGVEQVAASRAPLISRRVPVAALAFAAGAIATLGWAVLRDRPEEVSPEPAPLQVLAPAPPPVTEVAPARAPTPAPEQTPVVPPVKSELAEPELAKSELAEPELAKSELAGAGGLRAGRGEAEARGVAGGGAPASRRRASPHAMGVPTILRDVQRPRSPPSMRPCPSDSQPPTSRLRSSRSKVRCAPAAPSTESPPRQRWW